jgi:hypothetical protein
VEYGDETVCRARAWLADPAWEAAPAPLQGQRREAIGDRVWDIVGPVGPDGPRRWQARTHHGPVVVDLEISDRSGLLPEQGLQLLLRAAGLLDVEWIAARAQPPPQLEASPEHLHPWPLHPSHPLAASHACTTLPNGLAMGVAAVHPPWASLIGPEHPLWQEQGPDRLLGGATLNLIRAAMRREIRFEQRTVRGVHALAIGPHPLACACLLLPDLALWAADVVGGDRPLVAIPLQPHLLLVTSDTVQVPEDAWAPVLRLHA